MFSQVQGTYHDMQIDQLRNASQLGKPLYRSPPEDPEKVFQLAAATTQPQIMPAGQVESGSFSDRAMPIAQALSAQKNKGLHQPRLVSTCSLCPRGLTVEAAERSRFESRLQIRISCVPMHDFMARCIARKPAATTDALLTGVAYRNTPVWDDRVRTDCKLPTVLDGCV